MRLCERGLSSMGVEVVMSCAMPCLLYADGVWGGIGWGHGGIDGFEVT